MCDRCYLLLWRHLFLSLASFLGGRGTGGVMVALVWAFCIHVASRIVRHGVRSIIVCGWKTPLLCGDCRMGLSEP